MQHGLISKEGGEFLINFQSSLEMQQAFKDYCAKNYISPFQSSLEMQLSFLNITNLTMYSSFNLLLKCNVTVEMDVAVEDSDLSIFS